MFRIACTLGARRATAAVAAAPLRVAARWQPAMVARVAVARFSGEAVQSFLDRSEVTERVVAVLKNFQRVDPAKVTPTAHFVDDFGLDRWVVWWVVWCVGVVWCVWWVVWVWWVTGGVGFTAMRWV